jgi:hypothetical protein
MVLCSVSHIAKPSGYIWTFNPKAHIRGTEPIL